MPWRKFPAQHHDGAQSERMPAIEVRIAVSATGFSMVRKPQ